jgi:hypothetical protein
MSTKVGSRQFRALLTRLKPLAEGGLQELSDLPRQVHIRPRQPSRRPTGQLVWLGARIGRISLSFDICAELGVPNRLHVSSEPLLLAEEQARATFEGLFGNCDVYRSKSGKGWWMKYVSSSRPAWELIVTFDAPSLRGPCVFSAALIQQVKP